MFLKLSAIIEPNPPMLLASELPNAFILLVGIRLGCIRLPIGCIDGMRVIEGNDIGSIGLNGYMLLKSGVMSGNELKNPGNCCIENEP